MKKVMSLLLVCLLLPLNNVYARDSIASFSIAEALSSDKAKELLGTSVKFYFGEQKHAAIAKTLGEFRTNRKTNAFNKSDKAACEWAFLSAMVSLRDRALQMGATAVVDIKSNYRNNLTSSDDSFQCGAGTAIAGVALVGTMVKM
jgi:uncharacterized protein YbjQ (UPF0145 family)